MPRGRPLDDAPGWRIVERPASRSWRAGYLIVPAAIALASLQLLLLWDGSFIGLSDDRRQGSVSEFSPGAPESSAEPVVPSPPAPRSFDRSSAPAQEPVGDAAPLDAEAPGAAALPSPDEPAAGSPAIQVFIHHAIGADNALPAVQLAAYLETHGFVVTDIRPVELDIEQPSVRYFFEGDQSESRRLVEAIGAFFADAPDRAPDQPADFSHFTPKPSQGNVEVWLPSPVVRESEST